MDDFCIKYPTKTDMPLKLENKIFYNEVYTYVYIGQMSRVFANGPGDRGSIPDRVIPKTQKWYLMPSAL